MKTFIKIVSYTIILALIIGISYMVVIMLENKEPIEYKTIEKTEEVIEHIVPKSDVEQAKDMLAQATAKLDAQEAILVAEIKEIKNQADIQIAEREAKIAEINNIRSSF